MQKNKKLVIIGSGETAELAYEYFEYDSCYQVEAFAVDAKYVNASTPCGLPLCCIDELCEKYPCTEYDVFVAIVGKRLNRDRAEVYSRIKNMGYRCASYISSKAFVWHNVSIGENCFILENNVLQPFSKVGNNVYMWSGNHLGHRSIVDDNCFLASHIVISGYCEIQKNSFLGVNVSVADHTIVAHDNYIAMGSVVNKNTKPDRIYAGNPAKYLGISATEYCGVYLDEK